MARNDPVPDSHEVVRWIARKYIEKDDDGNIVRTPKGAIQNIDPAAYDLRDNEDYLSVTWLDFFSPEKIIAVPLAAETFRKALESQKLSAASAFSIAAVKDLKLACKTVDANVRVLEEAELGNDAHVAVRRYPRGNFDLFKVLATTTFSESYSYGELKSWGVNPPACIV